MTTSQTSQSIAMPSRASTRTTARGGRRISNSSSSAGSGGADHQHVIVDIGDDLRLLVDHLVEHRRAMPRTPDRAARAPAAPAPAARG